jgi:outer membrane protein assembly factor BamE (lipoprotein component of BamABCDE complex)
MGCVASGVQVTEDQAKQFEKGKATYQDVVAKLGQPNSTLMMGNGMRFISYSYVEAAARPATFIPIVGAFVGGADSRSNVVTFTFDDQGILTNFMAVSSQHGSGLGGAAGTQVAPVENQPRRTQ